ncbi:MAG: hypothetical protein AAFU57_00010 [Bacteroidota bacterium]
MKKVLSILVFLTLTSNISAQYDSISKNGEGFDSVFGFLEEGYFTGTINGILILENMDGSETVLDFQGSNAKLEIEKDEHNVYDLSFKKYSGQTTSGKTKILYETYGLANAFTIDIGGVNYKLSMIDGGCDLVINGLEYLYKKEIGTEYLILRFSKKIELWENEVVDGKKLWVKPESTITLAITR